MVVVADKVGGGRRSRFGSDSVFDTVWAAVNDGDQLLASVLGIGQQAWDFHCWLRETTTKIEYAVTLLWKGFWPRGRRMMSRGVVRGKRMWGRV